MQPNASNLRRFAALAAAAIVCWSAQRAEALSITGVNDATLQAVVDFQYTAATGVAVLDIKNTSTAFNPLLTGFAFNVPGGVSGLSAFSILDDGDLNRVLQWSGFFDLDGLDLPQPFGFFDAGALAGDKNTFNGGGDPQNGIVRGQTVRFSFTFSGPGIGSLDANDFLGASSFVPAQGPGSNGTSVAFVGRFQQTGSGGGGSDVAIPGPDTPPPPVGETPIPEPTTLALVGLGALGLLRRRLA